jgi:hypothetical protein
MRRFSHYVFPEVLELRRRAEVLSAGWGGSDLEPDLGSKGRIVSAILGRRTGMVLAKLRRRWGSA